MSDPPNDEAFVAAFTAVCAAVMVVFAGISRQTSVIPYNTSMLTGFTWVSEQLGGNSRRMRNNLGVSPAVFLRLAVALRTHANLTDSKYIAAEVQLAMFLYTCRKAAATREVEERFQHSTATVSKYFHAVLDAFVDSSFYHSYVVLPNEHTALSSRIANNPKLFPFFQDCLGAIDCTHIDAHVPATDVARYRDRDGNLSFNHLAACSLDMYFLYVLPGWEGSAGDGRVFLDSRMNDFSIPPTRYYLADAGFPSCNALLVPYRNVRYHLREYLRGSQRPQNYKELFNLRHAQARNVVERIFGVMKRRFPILQGVCEYPVSTQVKLFAALCALHNFIIANDGCDLEYWSPEELDESDGVVEPPLTGYDQVAGGSDVPPDLHGAISTGESDAADRRRDEIAQAMWTSYQQELGRRGTTM